MKKKPKAKDKETSKKKKAKQKKKVAKKPKPKQKKSAKKSPRLAKSKKIKTTRMKKSKTRVEKAKLKVTKKVRMQEVKRTTRKLAKAKTAPVKKRTVRKKVSELQPKKATKVVQKRTTYTRKAKNMTLRKLSPKKVASLKKEIIKKQKLKELKRKTKTTQKKITKPLKKPKVIPSQKPSQKKIVKKEVKLAKHFKPIKKTSHITKKQPTKITQKTPKKTVQETKKNLNIRKITPQKTASRIKTRKTRQQKVQKLKRVRQMVKTDRRISAKPRKVKIAQAQKHIHKKASKKAASRSTKAVKQVSKKFSTKMKQEAPKGIEQVKVPRKYQSLLAVEKTKSAATMTTVSVEDVVPSEPKMVQEVGLASRRKTVISSAVSHITNVSKDMPTLDSAPVIKQTKQTLNAKTAAATDTQKDIKKEVRYAQAVSLPSPTKVTEQRVTYEAAQTKVAERNIQTSATAVETDIPATEAPQVARIGAVFRKEAVSTPTPSSVVPSAGAPSLDSAPAADQQAKQILTAKTSARSSEQPVEKELQYSQAVSTPTVATKVTEQRVTYEAAQTKVSERNIQTSATAVETDIPATEAPQVAQIGAVSRKEAVSTPTPSSVVPSAGAPSLDSAPTVDQQTKQILTAAATVSRSTEEATEKSIEFEASKATAGGVAVSSQKNMTYSDSPSSAVSTRQTSGPSSDIVSAEDFSPESQSSAVSNIGTSSRSETQVQSTFSESVSSVAAGIPGNENLPVAAQSKSFTQAKMSTDSGEEGDVEGKVIQTERISDGTANVTELAARASKETDLSGIDSSVSTSMHKRGGGIGSGGPDIAVNLPSGNMTNDPLFRLTAEVDGDVKGAFVTVNGNTQIAVLGDGQFLTEVSLVKGINEISVLVFNSSGGVGKKDFKLLYSPPQGVPTIILESPENGKQGAKAGDPVMVEGTIDDHRIKKAKLLLNGIPIPVKVVNGHFKRKIFLPPTRVTTFRIMATGRNGQTGYSSLHTVLIGYDIDILNPRPY